jgi:hypothetical protein
MYATVGALSCHGPFAVVADYDMLYPSMLCGFIRATGSQMRRRWRPGWVVDHVEVCMYAKGGR